MLIGYMQRPGYKKESVTKSDAKKELQLVSCTGQSKGGNGKGTETETDMVEGSGLEHRM